MGECDSRLHKLAEHQKASQQIRGRTSHCRQPKLEWSCCSQTLMGFPSLQLLRTTLECHLPTISAPVRDLVIEYLPLWAPMAGEQCDVLDHHCVWCKATILSVNHANDEKNGTIVMKYDGWKDSYNTHVPFCTGRVLPLGEHSGRWASDATSYSDNKWVLTASEFGSCCLTNCSCVPVSSWGATEGDNHPHCAWISSDKFQFERTFQRGVRCEWAIQKCDGTPPTWRRGSIEEYWNWRRDYTNPATSIVVVPCRTLNL